jgi:ribonuclease P protein component
MFSFKKEERLCHQAQITQLVKSGSSFLCFPIKVTYLYAPQFTAKPTDFAHYPAKLLIVVAKRRYKHAHDRNRLKRLLREAYRLNKTVFYNDLRSKNAQIIVQFSYIANEELPLTALHKAVQKCFEKLSACAPVQPLL